MHLQDLTKDVMRIDAIPMENLDTIRVSTLVLGICSNVACTHLGFRFMLTDVLSKGVRFRL